MHSTKDTATMLGISRQRVLALIQAGTLNATVTDKGYRVDGDSIKARLEAIKLRQVRGLPGYRAQA
jgi:biotin operon repressor